MFIGLTLSSTQTLILAVLPLFIFLALPFAGILLFSGVRKSLSVRKRLVWAVAILVLIPAALASVTGNLITSDYLRFIEQDDWFYQDFARACEAIRLKSPPDTNDFVKVFATNVQLPKIVQKWNPQRLTYYSNGIDILVGEGHSDFGISWHQTQVTSEPTNLWVLETYGEPPERRLYTELRR
jgi:hypothetical protein